MARKRPTKRTEGRQQFTAQITPKNVFPPLDVQAVGRRSNDKVAAVPRKGVVESNP